jgi:hypothetical protein
MNRTLGRSAAVVVVVEVRRDSRPANTTEVAVGEEGIGLAVKVGRVAFSGGDVVADEITGRERSGNRQVESVPPPVFYEIKEWRLPVGLTGAG